MRAQTVSVNRGATFKQSSLIPSAFAWVSFSSVERELAQLLALQLFLMSRI